jgi:hypothetical protein
MRSTTIARAIISAGVLSFLAATPAFAAPPSGPSGTITLSNSPKFGQDAVIHATADGKISAKASIYVSVACSQGADLVYLSSRTSSTGDYIFPLADQAGQGLNWENGGDADCEAWLIYRVEKGKSSEITVLAKTEPFHVTGTDSALSA